ncbi:hypothetical protein PPACK8108_LOCUS20754, partial [Phakopsora pachyrhizi]
YDDCWAILNSQSCCYVVYDFKFDLEEGTRNKVCFFAGSLEEDKIKNKMWYASQRMPFVATWLVLGLEEVYLSFSL